MPVFDFSNASEEKTDLKCTYTTFQSNETAATPEMPIMLLDNREHSWKHHSNGIFSNPAKRTVFDFEEEGGTISADILAIDSRFLGLLKWLGENHINVRLSGANRPDGYAVYKIREIAFGGGTKLSAEDGFLQFMIERLFASSAPVREQDEDEQEEIGDQMKLTSLQSITDFMTCAGRTLPDNIGLWARRNLAVARSHEVTPEERRHAQRALSIMMNIQWKSNYFESIGKCHIGFATDEKFLFRFLFQSPFLKATSIEEIYLLYARDDVAKDISATLGLTEDDTEKLYTGMMIYSHGIACMIAADAVHFSDEDILAKINFAYWSFLRNIKEENHETHCS